MSDWIPIDESVGGRKPIEADGNRDGEVMQLLVNGAMGLYRWDDTNKCVAWMRCPEPYVKPICDSTYEFCKPSEASEYRTNVRDYWRQIGMATRATEDEKVSHNYRRKKKPVKKYRPFANAEEHKPFRDRWVVHKEVVNHYRKFRQIDDQGTECGGWEYCFRNWHFEDGTAFGLEVKP